MYTLTNTQVQKISRVLIMSAASLSIAVIMGFSALVRIPIPGSPVPLTLQTFVLFLGAGILRRHYALQMVAWYLILGIMGAPFFTNGSGFNYLFGATGGYLIGFILAAAIIGYSNYKTSAKVKQFMSYIFAALMIYIPGLVQLKFVTGTNWNSVLQMGFYPFIVFDILKSVTAYLAFKCLPLDRIQ